MTQTVESQEDWQALFDGIAREIHELDMTRPMEDELQGLQVLHDLYFQLAAAADGTPWAELAQSTIDAKQSEVILIDEGDLIFSVTEDGHGLREVFSEPGQSGLAFGSDIEYADYHMTGTRSMPARPFVGLTIEYIDGFTGRVLDFAVESLVATGRV